MLLVNIWYASLVFGILWICPKFYILYAGFIKFLDFKVPTLTLEYILYFVLYGTNRNIYRVICRSWGRLN